MCVTSICPCFENKVRVFKVTHWFKKKIVKYNIGLSFQSQQFLLFLICLGKYFLWLI